MLYIYLEDFFVNQVFILNFKFLGCNWKMMEVKTWRRRKRNLGYWLLYDFFTSEGSKLSLIKLLPLMRIGAQVGTKLSWY